MTQEVTATKEEPGTKPAPDLAPPTGQQQTAKPDEALYEITSVVHDGPEQLVQLEPAKRKKTWGENRFNLVTYGGWALIGNEITSLGITESIKMGNDGKPRFAQPAYQKFADYFGGLKKHFSGFTKPGLMKYLGDYVTGDPQSVLKGSHAPRLPYLLVATIGGMFMVPFIKDREDRKGEIVRKLDRAHYGTRADTDPELVEAHKEMDEAPKQSWGSLWKGRVTTVISAAIADFAFGWPDALTTKIFKNNTTYQKYASLERISDVVANTVTDTATKNFQLTEKSQNLLRKVSGNGTWLLTLSTSLTMLFYASSKLFAKKRDQKLEQRYAQLHDNQKDAPDADETALAATLQAVADKPQPEASAEQIAAQAIEKAHESSKQTTDKPQPQVSTVAHEATLAPAPQLAAAGI